MGQYSSNSLPADSFYVYGDLVHSTRDRCIDAYWSARRFWSIIGSPFIFQDGLHVVVTQVGVGILLLGVGLLSGIATAYLTKLFVQMTIQTTKAFMGMFKRRS